MQAQFSKVGGLPNVIELLGGFKVAKRSRVVKRSSSGQWLPDCHCHRVVDQVSVCVLECVGGCGGVCGSGVGLSGRAGGKRFGAGTWLWCNCEVHFGMFFAIAPPARFWLF